jgi:hypothetical protein
MPTAEGATETGAVDITQTSMPGLSCRHQPIGVFATVYQFDPGLAPSLGCVTGQTSSERPRIWPLSVDFQAFERGYMPWVSELGWIKGKAVFVMLDDQTFTRYEDTFTATGEPPTSSAPSGHFEPSGALGKVWRSQPGLSTRLGFAIAQVIHADTQLQMFQYGQMIDLPPAGVVIVLKQGQPGSWSLHAENQ